jgi:hypothetical protein
MISSNFNQIEDENTESTDKKEPEIAKKDQKKRDKIE